MNYTVELTADTTVKIGQSHYSTNKIGLRVADAAQPAGGGPVRVTVTVGGGRSGSDLLASPDERICATWRTSAEPQSLNPLPDPPAGTLGWRTGARGISLPVSIYLEDFESNTPPGTAMITVCVQNPNGQSREEPSVLGVPKQLDEKTEPAIRYFLVNPPYVMHAGQTEVTLRFLATGFDRVVLFRNNEKLQEWSHEDDRLMAECSDRPSITSAYRLEGFRDDGKVRRSLDQTVQVMSSGWNRIALPQGSPIRLFVANDFNTGDGNRLYGVFKDESGRYALYSSATGVDAWRPEAGDVPKRMATSPGVVYKNKLWLVGGSSVKTDESSCHNEVWCYEHEAWHCVEAKGPIFSERMGHACVIFPTMNGNKVEEEIWVFGGYENGCAYNDLWRGKEDPKGTLVWERINGDCGWAGRLNHAAVTLRDGDSRPQIWMYGGAGEPQTTENFYDWWTTYDGTKWEENKTNCIVPAPGRPLGSALVVSRARTSSPVPAMAMHDGEDDRLFLLGSFQDWAEGAMGENRQVGNRVSSYVFEWHSGNRIWELQPVFHGWQQFRGDNFYMQAIAFNGFLFVWSLRQNMDSTVKLNVLVPS